VRSWRALTALFVLPVCCWVAGANAATAATPVCKAGQVSTKAKPCITSNPPSRTQIQQPQQDDPGNTGTRSNQTDAVTIFRFLDPSAGKYQLEIQNTSGIGFINTFNWVPPAGMTITAITSSEGGRCTLVGGDISCVAGKKGIAPPKCTCEAGGAMTVNFTATGDQPTFNGQYWTYYGVVGSRTDITSMTPVPYHIPSFLSPALPDIPICAKGTKSTTAHPCTTQQ